MLLEFARQLGVVGGLHCYETGPSLLDDGRLSFRHDLSILGEVTFERSGGWDREAFEQFKCTAGFKAADQQPVLVDESTGLRAVPVPVEVTAMRMADRKALRWLLAGSMAHRMWGDPSQVRITRN
jgi:hypothetical protein